MSKAIGRLTVIPKGTKRAEEGKRWWFQQWQLLWDWERQHMGSTPLNTYSAYTYIQLQLNCLSEEGSRVNTLLFKCNFWTIQILLSGKVLFRTKTYEMGPASQPWLSWNKRQCRPMGLKLHHLKKMIKSSVEKFIYFFFIFT